MRPSGRFLNRLDLLGITFGAGFFHDGTQVLYKAIAILITPNDPFRQSLKKILMNRFPFIDIQEVSDGTEGMDKVNTFDPNLIFLEIHLPAQSGLDLARRIKSDHPAIVIVILISYDLPEYQTAAQESRVEHLVPKDEWTGVDMIDLVQLILSDQDIDKHEGWPAEKNSNEDCP